MVTYHELDGVKPGAVQELADGWGKLWRKRLEQRGDDVHEYAGRLRNHWEGEAADAAFGRLKRFRNELDATKAPVTTIETMLSGLAESLVQAKGMLDDAKAEAQRIPAKIVADGGDIEITYTGDEDLDKDHKMAIARSMADVLDTIDDALDIAAKADKSAAKALRELVPGFDPTSRRTGDVSAKDIPKPGTDPAKVNKWWNSLSPAEQQYLIHKYPERIGWLDGVPAICRDQANKVTLERERERNETRKDALLDRKHELESEHSPGGASERAAELERIKRELSVVNNNLKGIAALQDRLDEPGKGQPKAYLLGFEPGRLGDRDGDGMPDDDGRVVLAVGNPDTADNVATYVPGTGNDLGGVAGAVGYTDRMARDAETTAPHDDTAVIMWLGYDAPDDPLLNSPSGEYAQAASDDLRRFQDGLRATHEGERSHNTVLGHSYGSTVIGYAARDDLDGNGTPDGINADELVFVGSPGVGVDRASELGMDPDHVWATRAEHDMIKRVPDFWFGTDPSHDRFGGQGFVSGAGDPDDEKRTHSGYWDDEKARKGMAGIITGNYDTVPGATPPSGPTPRPSPGPSSTPPR